MLSSLPWLRLTKDKSPLSQTICETVTTKALTSWVEDLTTAIPHDYPGHIVAQEYLPKELAHHQFFQADPSGKYEEALAHYYQKVKEILKK